jgi:hypothetical protein
MAETSTTKERLTREKHANYLVYALCNIGASKKSRKTKFLLSLMTQWVIMKCDWTKDYDANKLGVHGRQRDVARPICSRCML